DGRALGLAARGARRESDRVRALSPRTRPRLIARRHPYLPDRLFREPGLRAAAPARTRPLAAAREGERSRPAHADGRACDRASRRRARVWRRRERAPERIAAPDARRIGDEPSLSAAPAGPRRCRCVRKRGRLLAARARG